MTTRRHRCGGCGRNLPVNCQRPYFCSTACRDRRRKNNREYARKYYAADPEKHRQRSARWIGQNPDKRAIVAKRWRESNQERIRAQRKAWAAANKDKRQASWRRWVSANPEKNRAKVRAWALANPELAQAQGRTRRARMQAAPGAHTAAEWRACVERYGRRCFYCGASSALTADHIIALARGGSNAIENIVPACRRCNSSKRASDARAWIARVRAEGMVLTDRAIELLATTDA